MDVPTLILLGAAGGLLRGALDLYNRFVSWQADHLLHRQSTAEETAAQGLPPRFGAYFDPAVDTVAAVLHSAMGAGAAVLFGTTGQISGEYAALVVGMSAPILLTQLSRIQSVNELLTADQQPAGRTAAAPEAAPEPAAAPAPAAGAGAGNAGDPPAGAGNAAGAGDAAGAGGSRAVGAGGAAGVPTAREPSGAPPRTEPLPSSPSVPPADPVRRPLAPEGPPLRARPAPSPRQAAATADAHGPRPLPGEAAAARAQFPDPGGLGDTPVLDPADGAAGLDGRAAPRWRRGPARGEEGL
ncbi:hypothetical protein ACFWUQ_23565 [Streptomyces sp. NPDC058662]|uniref:hypothetical protein n=1 Tax=Streptomyces sp. NPDC058662 TaxID=3346583 RepID=UPI003663FB64